MGALKDIVDLCVKLRDEVGDRKAAEVLSKIQSLTLSLQSEHITIIEKNHELLAENLSLKQKIFELETNHAKVLGDLKAADAGKNHRFLDDYTHWPQYGLYSRKRNQNGYLCGKCLPSEIESLVTDRPSGWKCPVCDAFFHNPASGTRPLVPGGGY